MSYILEALKKADADRERSRVPDLHAQPDPLADRDRQRSRSRDVWVRAALFVVLGAGLAWWTLSSAPTPAPAPASTATAPTGPAPGAAPERDAVVADRPPPAVPPAAPPAKPPATVIAVEIAPPATPRPVTELAKPTVTSPAVTPALPAAAAASAGAVRLPTLAELPADVRSQLPVLNVGGSMYSTSASVRMLILSGQVFREGDSPAPGLTVVQIGPKSTVLSFRGQRFELKH
jgi:general secretion pathway protein B